MTRISGALLLCLLLAGLCLPGAGCKDDDVSLGSDALRGGAGDGDGDVSGDGSGPGGGSVGADDGDASGGDGSAAPGSSDTGTDVPGSAGAGAAGDGDGDGSGDASNGNGSGGDGDGDMQPPANMGAACGSRGLAPCPDGQFCNHPVSANCGATDIPGVCETVPDACIEIFQPVCGCDSNTYSNSCAAAAAGVSVQSEGECAGGDPGSGDRCGGFAGFACPDGEYCDFAAGDGCGIADGLGVCKTQPSACTRELAPVCGCDGVTYSNPCTAAAAGASVLSTGMCKGGGCGGGALCGTNQYCDGASGDSCGVADGSCVDGSTACTLELDTVCGCDGKDYSNPCAARAAGAGIDRRGPC